MEENIEKLLAQYSDPFSLVEFFLKFRTAVIQKTETEIATRKELVSKNTKEAEELSGFLTSTSQK